MPEPATPLLFHPAPRAGRRRALIGLTPLIDMVFILLVFFMLASSFLDWRALAVTPAETANVDVGAKGALLVSVQRDGLRLGGHLAEWPEIARQVGMRLDADPDRRILVDAGPGVPLQAVVDVLDRLSGLGARRVALTGEPQ